MTDRLRHYLPPRGGANAKLTAVLLVGLTVACLIGALVSGPWWYVWRAWGMVLLAAAAGFAVLWAARPPAARRWATPPAEVQMPHSQQRTAGDKQLVSAIVDLMDHLPTDALRYRVGRALGDAGVSQFIADGELFDPHRHTIVGLEQTVDESRNDHVARTLGPGFVSAHGVLKPARVSLYRVTVPSPSDLGGGR